MKLLTFPKNHPSEMFLVITAIVIAIGFSACWSGAYPWWEKSLLVLSAAALECCMALLTTWYLYVAWKKRDDKTKWEISDHSRYGLLSYVACCIVLAIIVCFVVSSFWLILWTIVCFLAALVAGIILFGATDETMFGRF